MKHNKTRNIFIILGCLIVLLLIGVFWQLHTANQPANQAAQSANSYQKEQESEASSLSASSSSELTEKQKKFRKELAKAPKGHYIHLTKEGNKVYKTTWTKQEVLDYVNYTNDWNDKNLGEMNQQPFDFRDFGTDSADFRNHQSFSTKFAEEIDLSLHPKSSDHSQTDFQFYFNSPEEVANDKDVQEYATELEY